MLKATIIYGHDGSGKREKADEIGKQYKHIIRMNIWGLSLHQDQFLFRDVTKETDLIIVDGLKDDHCFEFWLPFIGGKITVNKKMKHPFTRETPKLLFIIDKKPEFTRGSFIRRFDFIECKRPIQVRFLRRGDKFKIIEDKSFSIIKKIEVLDDRMSFYHTANRKITCTDGSELICDPDQEVIVSNH